MAKWAIDKKKEREAKEALRPVDLIFPQRREALHANKCIPAPLGCGGEALLFRDELSRKEYRISGFCQKCQDGLFSKK